MFGTSFSRSFKVGNRPITITAVDQIPSLEVDYKSDLTTAFSPAPTNGSNITAWANAGGLTSHDWNSTGGNRPTYVTGIANVAYGVVAFNLAGGTSQRFTINPVTYINSKSGVTMFHVFKSSSTAAGIRYITSTDVGGYQWGQNGTQWVGGFAGATFTVNTTVADTSWHIMSMKFDGTGTGNAGRLAVRLDGTDQTLTYTGTVGTATSASAGYFYGGCTGTSSNSTSNHYQGYLAETVIYTKTLTTGELIAVEDYLNNKWVI